jgi:CheY-like chemotaxis protein
MRILIAEGSKATRPLLRATLEDMGFPPRDVLEAQDGHEALSLIRTSVPDVDVVLADWELPGAEGYALLRGLRHAACGREISVVSRLNRDQRVGADDARRWGVRKFLERPFGDEAFRDVIRSLEGSIETRKIQDSSRLLGRIARETEAEPDLPFFLRIPSAAMRDFLDLAIPGAYAPGDDARGRRRAGRFPARGHVRRGRGRRARPRDRRLRGRGLVPHGRRGRGGGARADPGPPGLLPAAPAGRTAPAPPLPPAAPRRARHAHHRSGGRLGVPRLALGAVLPRRGPVPADEPQERPAEAPAAGGERGGGEFTAVEAVHAWAGGLEGESAFRALAGWKGAAFDFESGPPGGSVSIATPTSRLLLEALREAPEPARAG